MDLLGPKVNPVAPFTDDLPTANRVIEMEIVNCEITDPEVRILPLEAKPGNSQGKLPGRFDFKANGMGHGDGKWIKVEVTISDPRVRFRSDDYYLSAGDDSSTALLRRGGRTPDRMSFYVCRSKEPKYLSYNLGVIVTAPDGSEHEIHIDPKIENGGGK